MLSSGTTGLIQNQAAKEARLILYGAYDQKWSLRGAINQWMGGVATALDRQTDLIKCNSEIIDIYTTDEMLNNADFVFINNPDNPGFKILVCAISATAFNQKVRNGFYPELIQRCNNVLQVIEQELQ